MNKSMIGIDLGTYEIKVYDKLNDNVIKHKNAIAIQKIKTQKHVFATGDDAFEMYAKCPSDIQVIYPMEGGVISDFDSMRYLFQHLICGDSGSKMKGAGYLMAVPTDMTEVEKKAFFDLIVHSDARTRNVRLVPSAIADAVSFGMDVLKENCIFLMNIGAAKTEYSVLSKGGLFSNKMEKIGGNQIDQAIISHIRREYNFFVGKFAAEDLKNGLGTAIDCENDSVYVTGRSLISGLPGEIEISSHEIFLATKPVLDQIVYGCQTFLERIPPEKLIQIKEGGLLLTGGVACLRNITKYFEKEIGLPVFVHKRPAESTIEGIRKILKSGICWELTYTMLDNRNRWIK